MPSKHPIALSKSVQGKILQKALSPSSFDIAVSSCNAPVCALLGSCEGLVQALRGGHGGELSDATPVAES